MSKTQLTKQIEDKLSRWNPKKLGDLEIAYLRPNYLEFEVPVSHGCVQGGLVDCVWCVEGFTNPREYKHCSLHWYRKNCKTDLPCPAGIQDVNERCASNDIECTYRCNAIEKDNIKRIICFEIKISLSDFKSKNGHNFCGNLNYYVVPKDLYKDIYGLVPEHVGVIVYTPSSDRLSIAKECECQSIPEEDYSWFLLTCVNKRMKQTDKNYNKMLYAYREYRDLCSSLIFKLRQVAEAFPEASNMMYIDNYEYLYKQYNLNKSDKGDDILA